MGKGLGQADRLEVAMKRNLEPARPSDQFRSSALRMLVITDIPFCIIDTTSFNCEKFLKSYL
jgi:hypothetical protein